MLAALERLKQAVLSLPEVAEKIQSQFQRFSHLWTRPIAEALQVLAGHLLLLHAIIKESVRVVVL